MFDALRLCIRCSDRYTLSPRGICHACREQEMIDDSVPDGLPDAWIDDFEDENDDESDQP